MYSYIYVFFKQERPVMDDFEEERKISSQVLTDTLKKTSQNIFAYSFISEHSKHFILRMGGLTCSLREDAHKKF